MTTTTPPEHATVVCPACWKPVARKKWDDEGCCLSPQERKEHQ